MGKLIGFFILMLFVIVGLTTATHADDCDPAEKFCEAVSPTQACYDGCYHNSGDVETCLLSCERAISEPITPPFPVRKPKTIRFNSPMFDFELTIEK